MIPRDCDELPVEGVVYCEDCKQPVAIEDLIPADQPRTKCCNVPPFVKDWRAPSLGERFGPAWETFVPIPTALLALPTRELSTGGKIVSVALLDYARLPQVFPSQATLSEATGLDVKAVRRALRELEGKRWITRRRRTTGRGFRTSDRFNLAPLIAAINGLGGDTPGRRQCHPQGGESPGRSGGESPGRSGGESPPYLEVEDDLEGLEPEKPSSEETRFPASPDDTAADEADVW